ncbi:phosphonate metabolism protein/1,5-bisphosphokinase (PRPP-forming) PhnN [Meridianimarinicoccus sp. RP-17]|uniref:phosphonate metabolism protein/1,5-bisphosphokinase (PRPP-forming) PhnN n=1 Tax=Meridianimarinicoccus zhengii TaxID=2056810 RepID=UPI000DAEBDA0|nr:phosphonate metabolism protein/1,5-bisphosphokinase (PRPP-forming) PhnN [Phycocomes zhengii]
MTGRLIAVVGPSGVGKDSVMRGMEGARPGLLRLRRVITRPPGDPAEDFDAVDEVEFARRMAAGDFVLHWRAHGLSYGVPASLSADLSAGRDVLVNLSRGVLGQAARAFPSMVILRLSAPPAVLAARLRGRGREDAGDIAGRLARDGAVMPPDVPVVDLCNDGPLEATVDRALTAIYPAASG